MAHLNYTVGGDSNLVSFKSAARVPIDSLKVHFKQIQDLHGYDHPWPAGGGKNLLQYPSIDNGWVKGFLSNDTGSIADQQADALEMTTDYIPITSGAQYTFSCALSTLPEGGAYWFGYLFFDSEKAPVGTRAAFWYETYKSMTAPEGASFVRISLRTYGVDLWVQLESGSTATSYSPYSNICPISGWTGAHIYVSPTLDAQDGTTYNVQFPTEAGMVYGGTLDATNGELTVTEFGHVFDGTENMISPVRSDLAMIQFPSESFRPWVNISAKRSCSHFTNAHSYGWQNVEANQWLAAGGNYWGFGGYTTSEFKAYAAEQYANGTPITCYTTLTTPITYQLTPTELKTLLSTNNIWSNTNDVTEVSYAVHDSAMIRAAKRRMAMASSHVELRVTT